MNERIAAVVAWSGLGCSPVLTAASIPLLVWNIPRTGISLVPIFVELSAAVMYPGLGALIALRQRRNAVGWILLAIGFSVALDGLARQYALYGLITAPGSLPGAGFTAWIGSWVFQSGVFLLALFLLFFPDGHLPTQRWRPLVWIVVGETGLATFGALLSPGELTAGNQGVYHEFNLMANPTAVPALEGLLVPLKTLSGLMILPIALAVTAGLIWRFRQSKVEERQQVKWLAYTAAVFCFVVLADIAVGFVVRTHWVGDIGWVLAAITVVYGFPAAATVAILRYRLYDIDLVINRSLVFGTLAVFITGVYVGIVAGVGALIGTRGQPSLGLSILATAIVAVAFQPVREMVERLVNRMVYGKRATPYEVLSHFTERAGGTYAGEEILPRMAQVLAEGTGSAHADVWLRLGDRIAPAASWPAHDGQTATSVALSGQLLPSIPGVTRVVPVRHQGELLGAFSINKRPGEALTPVEDELLKNLAAQAGLVLRNVRLTAELRARLDEISKQARELRASRQRIVAAQDAERHRLERNIHDGAQQNLVALTVKLRLAASLAKRDPHGAGDAVKALVAESDQALETLRALAQGLYPPLLREHGLVPALRADTEGMPVTSAVDAVGLGRYAPDVEAAVYFVCLEALQNVMKHARASHVTVKLSSSNHALSFEIADDGTGFEVGGDGEGSGLRNMADRMEAIGGRLDIQSTVEGTTVRGVVPMKVMEAIA